MTRSKTPIALFALAMLILGAVTLVPRPTAVIADGHGEGDELHEAMEEMNGLYRQVRRQARDETKNADTADKLSEMAALALAAKAYIPEMVSELPADQQGDLANTYRAMMNELVVDLLTAENALLEGDNAAAWAAVLEANDVKGRGHELFIPEDE